MTTTLLIIKKRELINVLYFRMKRAIKINVKKDICYQIKKELKELDNLENL